MNEASIGHFTEIGDLLDDPDFEQQIGGVLVELLELALEELKRCSGTQFWPPAVTALTTIIRDGTRAVRYPNPQEDSAT